MMNDALREQISAYVDGELSVAEAELLVRRLSQDAELRQVAAGYLSIGRALRGESATGLRGLREKIAAELDDVAPSDDVVEVARPERQWAKPLAGVGIAATVAAVALIGLQSVGPAPSPSATVATSDLAAVAIDEAPLYTEPPVDEVLSDRPSEMLTRYYQQHNDRTADIGGSGILTRLVELELRNDELANPDAEDAEQSDEQDEQAPSGSERD